MSQSPIDDYLDMLLPRLRGRPADVRRMLTETEDHLREAAAAAVAQGSDPAAAERLAVERFGSPRLVARHFGRGRLGALTGPALREATVALTVLGVIGMLAIGASGAVAAGMGALWGKAFVSGDASGVTYTAARCADLREYAPSASSCQAAAVQHHYGEIVDYRLAAGVLGLLALGGLIGVDRLAARRRRAHGADGPTLRFIPAAFTPTVGAALFGAAGALLGADGLALLAQGRGHGAGAQLSAAIVAAPLALVFAVRLVRVLAQGSREQTGGVPVQTI